jgi:hypothetical protein
VIYQWFKRNRAGLFDARRAAILSKDSHEIRMHIIMKKIAREIDSATCHGEHGVTFEHAFSPTVTQEFCKRLQALGYKTTPSAHPEGTYIAWLPLQETKVK